MRSFPPDFLWGAATAGHQVEGGNVNADLWPMEWAPNSTFNEPSGDACDHYHRYPEDIATLAELGLNAYRFSLEWSRIEPEPGFYSRAALDHYKRMIESCLNQGVMPVVTYNHFTVPRWMAGRGGWSAEDAPGRFADYASRVTQHFGDLMAWVCTLNEPNLMAMMRSTGVLAMGTGDRPPATEPVEERFGGVGGYNPARYRMGIVAADVEQMTQAHRLAVQAIKSTTGTIKVGWTLALVDLQPAEGGEERWLEARRLGQTDWLSVSADDDFVGVPVLVTENGMATDDDAARLAYTRAALEGLAQCIEDGVDVRGYIHWTLLDNFEWNAGYSKTFGLISVDRETSMRSVKPSGHWLGRVAQHSNLG